MRVELEMVEKKIEMEKVVKVVCVKLLEFKIIFFNGILVDWIRF